MLIIPLIYLLFGVLFGVVLLLFYLIIGYKFEQKLDFFFMLFPSIGWGNVVYKKSNRKTNRWHFIFKYMWIFHCFFIVTFGIIGFVFFLDVAGLLGWGTNFAQQQENEYAAYLGYFAEFGIWALLSFVCISYLLIMGFITLIMIILPKTISHNLKRNQKG